MDTYSVSDVALMLDVNEETVRRWIREGKLSATRKLGRGGSSVSLENIVDFVNQPPRTYVEPLVLWMNDHDIEYLLQPDKKENARTAATTAATIAGSTALGLLVGGPIGAIAGGAVGTGAGFTIGAISKPCIVLNATENQDEYPDIETGVVESQPAPIIEAPDTNDEPDTDDIESKIVAEQMKLIRLKQEQAQISAKISICEGQIEYYKLLTKKK